MKISLIHMKMKCCWINYWCWKKNNLQRRLKSLKIFCSKHQENSKVLSFWDSIIYGICGLIWIVLKKFA